MKSLAKTTVLLPVVLMSVALATPAYSNWFSNPYTGINRNIGSAPSPTPQDIRESRHQAYYPVLSQELNEQGTVGLRISLSDMGTTSAAVVERSSGNVRLDDAALEFVRTNWYYQPTLQAGWQLPPSVRVNVTFRLE